MSGRPTIVLTGFGPFPGVPVNASATLVTRLANAARTRFPTHETVHDILPTEWNEVPERLRKLINLESVVLVLHFGVAQDAAGFRLELVGRNLQTSLQDTVGNLPKSVRVIEDGPDLLATTVPAERIAARLMGLGLPCTTSDNAGTYLCNALFYHSLAAAHGARDPHLAGFVHIPASLVGQGPEAQEPHPACPLDWQMAVSGGLEIIAACLGHIAQHKAP